MWLEIAIDSLCSLHHADRFRRGEELARSMRQRVRRAIDALADQPYPSQSKRLEFPDNLDNSLCRLRLDKWRIVYLVADADHTVDILAVRKRPPYDYGDLQGLLAQLG